MLQVFVFESPEENGFHLNLQGQMRASWRDLEGTTPAVAVGARC